MAEPALLELSPPRAVLTLHRPDARNALSIGLLEALHARLDGLEQRTDVIVLTLRGEGRAFCAGMDLKEVLGVAGAPLRLLTSLARFALRLRRLPMVSIARVQGAAIGGGCGLACVTDFCLTHADSKMGFPEVDLGVCPAVVAPWLMRKVGAGRARAILLRGGLMSGRSAHEAGLADHCVDSPGDLDSAVHSLENRLAEGGPLALRATKALLNELDGSLDETVLRRGAEISAAVLATPEAQERLRAKLAS